MHLLFTNYTTKLNHTLDSLIDLNESGFHLLHNFNIPCDKDKFDINMLNELRDIFVELDLAYEAKDLERAYDITTYFKPKLPNMMEILSDLMTAQGKDALKLKYIDIPTIYLNNKQNLIQFTAWLEFHDYKIRKSVSIIQKKYTRMTNSFSRIMQIYDVLVVEVQNLYNKFMKP
ncbi:uncharacterized protein LOC110863108 [Folsomia candida]|uniref:uncharacterized protein LOC110863108 n=1 Tax=Folsomia candida TaxID=158441 RepID=UPI0016051BD4|nr:uncharacterized protein LOC110863108 [Folsomia candida]XP_035711001.1 uncharacterized protein LOC110863108 [Folsomia candida]